MILLAQLSHGPQSQFLCLTERRVPGHDPAGPVVTWSPGPVPLSYREAGTRGMESESLPPLGCFFTVTDAENKTQTQAGLETKPMEQMESNSLTDDTAIPTH